MVGLPGKRTVPYVGSHFVSSSSERSFLMDLNLRFFHNVVVSSLADLRNFAEVASSLEGFVGIPRFHWECHYSPSLWAGRSGALSRIVAKFSDPSAGCPRTRDATSPVCFSRGYSSGNHVGRVEASSWTARCGFYSGFACSATAIIAVRKQKKKVNMSTVIGQQDEAEVPTLSRSQVDFTFKTTSNSRSGAVSRSCVIVRVD